MFTPAYIPFLDPIEVHAFWYLLIVPLAFGVAVAYKAVRVEPFIAGEYWRAVVGMTAQVVLGIAGLWVAGVILVQYVLPVIAP
jgi:hypothetical protein